MKTAIVTAPPGAARNVHQTMNKILLTVAAAAALGVSPRAQLAPADHFRRPSKTVETPTDAMADLQVMLQLAREHGTRIDDRGREVCDHPVWQTRRQSLEQKMFNLATFFGQILLDSNNPNDRRLAAYGTFYLDDPHHVFQLITFFAQEPDRSIRETAFKRSIDYLRVYLPRDARVDDEASATAPRPLYTLAAYPYLDLLKLEDPRDQAQGLWFLGQVMEIRPDSGTAILRESRARVRELLVSDKDLVRRHARAFVRYSDPKQRTVPEDDATDEALLAWIDEITDELFPPIQRVSGGLIDLYPSDELDRAARVGREALTTKEIGETASGKLSSGLFYRGYRINRLPEPLDKLGIPIGAVITSINSQPVSNAKKILEIAERSLEAGHRILVEFVFGGQSMVMEYRLRT